MQNDKPNLNEKRNLKRNLTTLAALFFLAALLSVHATAATYTVTKSIDSDDNVCDADCSLREAIAAANATTEDDAINFGVTSVNLNGALGTLRVLTAETAGKLAISNPYVSFYVTVSGGAAGRIFTVNQAGDLTVTGLLVRNGGGAFTNQGGNLTLINSILTGNSSNTSSGAGISSTNGSTLLVNTTIRGNQASGVGGGIYHEGGQLTVIDSTISSNYAEFGGAAISSGSGANVSIERSTIDSNLTSGTGALSHGGSGQVTIADSTIENNRGRVVGGVFNLGTMSIRNTTIFNNRAASEEPTGRGGGGIYNQGTLTVTGSTVSNNRSATPTGGGGGGIFSVLGTFNMGNSIVANNTTTVPVNGPDILGTVNSLGYNLIENTNSTTITGNTTGNITGVDPLLDPAGLKDNGGPTRTVALLAGSPAIDRGDPALVNQRDQRGFLRNVNQPDIGAFEFGAGSGVINLLSNPSFEAGFGPWVDWGGSDVVANPDAPNGNFESRIGPQPGGSYQIVSVMPNAIYSLGAWGRVSVPDTQGWMGVFFLDAAGNQIPFQLITEFNNTSYEKKRLVFQTPPNTASVVVWTWKNQGAHLFFVDQVTLVRE